MSLGTLLFTWSKGQLVGTDEFGNRYFTEKAAPKASRRRKRWVLYKGIVDASVVPPEWHAWLHYTVDEPLLRDTKDKPWLKPHQANLSGTNQAYLPPGHDQRGGVRERAPGDYEPWTPS